MSETSMSRSTSVSAAACLELCVRLTLQRNIINEALKLNHLAGLGMERSRSLPEAQKVCFLVKALILRAV